MDTVSTGICFDIEYIPGPKTIIANAFSRLLTVEDLHVVYLMEEFTMTTDKFKLLKVYTIVIIDTLV